MKRTAWVVAVLLAMGSLTARAEGEGEPKGEFEYAFQSLSSFFNVKVQDFGDGRLEGNATDLSGSAPILSYVEGDRLNLFWGNRTDFLTFFTQGNKTIYRGMLWTPSLSNFYVVKSKNGFQIEGTIGKKPQFRANVDTKRKSLSLAWDNVQFNIQVNKKEQGGCKGTFGSNGNPSELKVICHSSGTLEDALFKSPEAVIALVIHQLIYPQDDKP